MIFKCPYSMHILSSTKNAFRKLLIFSIRIYIQFCRNILKNHQNFVSKKCISPIFQFLPKSLCLFVLHTKTKLCTQGFPQKHFLASYIFLTDSVFFTQNDKIFKKEKKNLSKTFFNPTTRALENTIDVYKS